MWVCLSRGGPRWEKGPDAVCGVALHPRLRRRRGFAAERRGGNGFRREDGPSRYDEPYTLVQARLGACPLYHTRFSSTRLTINETMVHRRIVRRPRPARNDLTTLVLASERVPAVDALRGWERNIPVCQPSEHSTHASASARANPAIAASSCVTHAANGATFRSARWRTPTPSLLRQRPHPVRRLRLTPDSFTTNVSSPRPHPQPCLHPSRPRVEKRAKTTSHSRSKSSTERRIRSLQRRRADVAVAVRSLSRLSMGRDDRECPRKHARVDELPDDASLASRSSAFPRRARARGLVRRGWILKSRVRLAKEF